MGTTSRRRFLAGAAGVAAAAVVPTRWAFAETNATFAHGVGSFDPLHDRVILWTRTTAASVIWEVASEASFASILKTGTVAPQPATDYTVQVDVDGLSPATRYWYRFRANGDTSTIGRTQTLPAPGAAVERVRIGVVTCAEWEFGFFGGYRAIAERDDIDVVLALGDYIYEFGDDYGGIPSPKPGGRTHTPTHEIVTLADYRTRHRQYRTDPGLQKLHASHPVIAIYDDHEVCNDWWRDGGLGHVPATEGDFHARRDAGLRAFREWVPVRVTNADPTVVYRRFAFGNLVDLFMVDERRYRDKQPQNAVVGYFSVDPATDDPNRTMLGAPQLGWLENGLTSSTAMWKVLGNPDSMLPVDVGPALAGALSAALSPLGTPVPPVPPPLLVEGWDGYNGERTRLLNFIHDHNVKDVVVLTGDYHESFASQLPYDRSTYDLDGNSAAVEFIAPAITSPGLAETLQMGSLPNALTINTVFEANLAASNRWVKYHEGFAHGFGVAEFRADGMQFDFWFIEDRNDPNTVATPASSWTVPRGASVLAQAAGPLGPRPAVQPPAPAPAPAPGGVIPRTGANSAVALGLGAVAVAGLAAKRISEEFLQDG
jgi:alkaline phosphatase D